MFDDYKVFEDVVENRINVPQRYTIIQWVSDESYRKTLQKVCESISLATHIQTTMEQIHNDFEGGDNFEI